MFHTRAAPSSPSHPTHLPSREKATAQTPKEPVQTPAADPSREATATLPLLPQFSDGKAGGASFTFDFTNDNAKTFDTAIYRESAHLIFDGQDYRTLPLAQNGVAVEERRTWERGGQSVYFRDPERHLIEIATPGVWSIY